ncbi:hypothetical protein CGH52_24630, partial [Vibrio parahaemolyticus]|uniref:hypothetical protein n=3 Tax=Gammaproteobacteria TaxID=1236 RepID=UPI00116F994A
TMRKITNLTRQEKIFIRQAFDENERQNGKPLNKDQRKALLATVYKQIWSQRIADKAQKQRELERHAKDFTWKKPERFKR